MARRSKQGEKEPRDNVDWILSTAGITPELSRFANVLCQAGTKMTVDVASKKFLAPVELMGYLEIFDLKDKAKAENWSTADMGEILIPCIQEVAAKVQLAAKMLRVLTYQYVALEFSVNADLDELSGEVQAAQAGVRDLHADLRAVSEEVARQVLALRDTIECHFTEQGQLTEGWEKIAAVAAKQVTDQSRIAALELQVAELMQMVQQQQEPAVKKKRTVAAARSTVAVTGRPTTTDTL
jgi:hypothetical protein